MENLELIKKLSATLQLECRNLFEQVRILQHNQDINILNKIGVDIDDILICHAHIYELSNLLRDSLENLADEIKKCKTSYIKKINTQEHDK